MVLALASTLAFGQAQAKPNHLDGQTSQYLKRGSFSTRRLVPLVCRSLQACHRARPPDSSGCRSRVVSMVQPHGSRHVVKLRDCRVHQSTLCPHKLDFDAAPELVAQLQRAQAILNLTAGLPLTSFITPDGKLYFGGGYLPAEHKGRQSLILARQRKRLSSVMPTRERSPKNPFN